MIRVRVASACGVAMVSALLSVPAWAQQDSPVGPIAIDVRLALPGFSTADSIATPLRLRTDQLPGRGLGLEVGGHVYPVRRRRMTLGLGISLTKAGGEQVPEEDAPPTDPTIETRFTALSPQLSLNFGTSRGWSYVSAGYGWTRRTTGDASRTIPESPNLGTLNFGGGARWMLATHVGVSFDLRFYRLPMQSADGGVPESPRHTMIVGAVGLALK